MCESTGHKIQQLNSTTYPQEFLDISSYNLFSLAIMRKLDKYNNKIPTFVKVSAIHKSFKIIYCQYQLIYVYLSHFFLLKIQLNKLAHRLFHFQQKYLM